MTATESRIVITTAYALLALIIIAVPVRYWYIAAVAAGLAVTVGTLVLVVRRRLARGRP